MTDTQSAKLTDHTMSDSTLDRYCSSKVHHLLIGRKDTEVHIVPSYRRDRAASSTEKRNKRFNYKRPTAEIADGVGKLYVFPGEDYVEHYHKIYAHLGYRVSVQEALETSKSAIARVLPNDMPHVDTIIIGYVESLASGDSWHGNDDVAWRLDSIGAVSVMYVGVAFSYWGDILYHLLSAVAHCTQRIIHVGKLGSLNHDDVPNRTIVSGNTSLLRGRRIEWRGLFDDNPLVTIGAHVSLPSVLDETREWLERNRNEYRFVDPEIGWAAQACADAGIEFSCLHLVTDNLSGSFIENLTNERDADVVIKRLQYVEIIKSILYSSLNPQRVSMYSAVLKAQQARVDRNLLKPLMRNWDACLSFAYHTQEEAWEVVRELPRREWKDQTVRPDSVLSELADTQIQLLTTLAYAGFNEEDLVKAVWNKLQVKRGDWK